MVSSIRHAIRESIAVDRFRYELIAVPTGGNDYLGEWHCAICRLGDTSAISHPRTASALEWARNCVTVHHNSTHGD